MMTGETERYNTNGTANGGMGFIPGSQEDLLSPHDRERVEAAGEKFARALAAKANRERSKKELRKNSKKQPKKAGKKQPRKIEEQETDTLSCLAIMGTFIQEGAGKRTVDDQIKEACYDAFGYQAKPRRGIINVLLDSPGGSLDSAFNAVRYLTWYASELNIYVPNRAMSASTLLTLASNQVHMSAFGQLGPLDTQIRDPRNPSDTYISALDCYKSVDYVRDFGVSSAVKALSSLSEQAHGQVALQDMLETASRFAIGAITPMLKGVKALDFGGWGRSLSIGKKYAQTILENNEHLRNISDDGPPVNTKVQADEISEKLVYHFTHHLYPIDPYSARDMGLQVHIMDEKAYAPAAKIVRICRDKSFVGWLTPEERDQCRDRRSERAAKDGRRYIGGRSDLEPALAYSPPEY